MAKATRRTNRAHVQSVLRRAVGRRSVLESLESRQLLTATIYGVTGNDTLIRFDAVTPGIIDSTVAVTLQPGDSLRGIDFRPSNNALYGLGALGNIYKINPATGVTTSVALTADPGDLTAPFAGLSGSNFGVDFDPSTDHLRVISDAHQNVLIDVDTGRVRTDGNIHPAGEDARASAFVPSASGLATPAWYVIDISTDEVHEQDPETGTQNSSASLGVDVTGDPSFDIGATRIGYAAFTVGGVTGLYTLNVEINGAATSIGAIGTGAVPLHGLAVAPIVDPALLVVTNVDDSGNGSLRTAIAVANSLPGPNTITFNIPGAGAHTIKPTSFLPTIFDTVTIDGYSEPGTSVNTLAVGDNAVLSIVLDGSLFPGFGGLTIAGSGGSTIRGLSIGNFGSSAIGIAKSHDNVIEGNFIGTNASGTAPTANGYGVGINDSPNTRIGSDVPAGRNIISGNTNGVSIVNLSAGSVIEGNYIGTNATGTGAIGNEFGISIFYAKNITVGGLTAGARNVISGNITSNLSITGVTGATIQGNYVGLDAAGVAAIAGNGIGIDINNSGGSLIGGTVAGARNVISGNTVGLGNNGEPNLIKGNYIGTNAAGTAAVANGTGVHLESIGGDLFGGGEPGAGNLISGNTGNGLELVEYFGGAVQGNIVGLNAAGTSALPNGGTSGIRVGPFVGSTVIGGTTPGSRNVISGNANLGMFITSDVEPTTSIQGDYVGLDVNGNFAIGNGSSGILVDSPGIVIGGAAPGARNIISGNHTNGIDANGASVKVLGNYIGTDATGNLARPNEKSGVLVRDIVVQIGGAASGEGNVISGNLLSGIATATGSMSAKGNIIGLNASATAAIPNLVTGIELESSNNFIGGLLPGEGNVIAFNSGTGVHVSDVAAGNRIISNSFYSNALLGIDLGGVAIGDGITPNDAMDADSGANNLQNTPSLVSASSTGINTNVSGFLSSAPNSDFLIQVFADPLGDPAGAGEGRVFLGQFYVHTPAGGVVGFAADLPVPVPAGQRVSATASATVSPVNLDPLETSEFSNWVTVSGPPPQISINDVTVTEGNSGPVSATFTVSLSAASSVATTVQFITADGTANAQGDYLSQTGTVIFNAGETSKPVTITVNGDTTIEPTETFVVNLSGAVNGQIVDGQGVGTITNDDGLPPAPSFSINDISQLEGNGPASTPFTFTITRSGDISQAGSVQYATADSSALPPADYANVVLTTVNFAANQATAPVTVNVVGDTTPESDETFFVNLSNANVGASISDAQGLGTIQNDDAAAPPPMMATAVLGPDPAAPSKTALIVTGTDNGEIIEIDPGSSSSKLLVRVNGVQVGPQFNTSSFGRIVIDAKGGDDHVDVTTKTTKDTLITAGEGNDAVKGGNGNDVIIGGIGNDILSGRKGRDLIIGGAGADGITGDEDDDLIIAAATTYDTDLNALAAFEKEWTSSNSYSKRRDNVRNGTGSNVGGRKFNDASIIEDTAFDQLDGNGGTDLFFYHKSNINGNIADKFSNKPSSGETTVDAS